MDKEIICVDTSVFIDYFRKSRKDRTLLYKLSDSYDFAVSVITKLEISVGIEPGQKEFWDLVFQKVTILPLTENEIDRASEIIKTLRKTNRMIGLPDILIAATALEKGLKLSTLNVKDFERIEDLKLL